MSETLLHTSTTYDRTGSGSGYTGHHYYYIFKVYLVEQSIANNTSKIRITQEFWHNSDSLMWSTENYGPKSSVSLSIDGGNNYTDYVGGRIKYFWKSGYMGQTTRTVDNVTQYYCEGVSWITTVNHDSNGSKSIKVKSDWIQGSGATLKYYPYSFSLPEETIALPTIPRASTLPDISNITISSQSEKTTGTITVKASFYHSLTYKIGQNGTEYYANVSGTNNAINKRLLSSNTAFDIPYSKLLELMPSSKTGTLYVTLTTYSNSSGSAIVGTSSKTVSVSIDIDNFKPVIAFQSSDLSIVTSRQYFTSYCIAAGLDKLSASYSCTASYGSSIDKVYFELRGSGQGVKQIDYNPDSQTGIATYLSDTILESSGSFSVQLQAYAMDSRGVKSSTIYSNSLQILGYSRPSISVSNMFRVNGPSSTTEDTAGEIGYVLFSVAAGIFRDANGIVDIGNEIIVPPTSYTYTIDSVSYNMNPGTGNWFRLDEDKSAFVSITVSDKMCVGNAIGIIKPTVWTGHIFEAFSPFEVVDPDGTGKLAGFAFRAVAEQNLGKIGMPLQATSFRSSDYYDASNGNTATFHGNADSATSATNATNAVTATNSNNQAVTESDPSGATTYFPSFYSARTGNLPVRANDGLSYYTKLGTASALGFGGIKLGNAINQGTAGNKWGFLDIYPQVGAYYCRIRPVTTLTGNRTIYFPNANGTAMLEPTVLWEPDDPTTVGQGGKSISVNCSAYSYIKVWAHCYSVCFSFNVDLRRIPAYTIAGATENNVYRGSGSAPLYTTGASSARIENYYCMVQVNSAKTSVSVVQIGYIRGSSAREDRNGNTSYYIYRIEGFL